MPEPQREQFVREYIKDFNATKAAERAGYSKKTARNQGSRLLTDDEISKRVSEALKKRLERVEVDADYVLKELIECWEADIADLFTDNGTLKKLSEIPRAWRRMLGGMSIKKISAGYGDDEDVLGEIINLAHVDKSKYLKMLGDHTNIKAFDKSIELTGKDGGPIELTDTQRAAKLASIMAQAVARGSEPSEN